MSSSLQWKPAFPAEGGTLDYELKRAISRRLWDTDGSTGHGEATVTRADLPYLEGLRDAGVKGAQKLIDLIEKHEAVIVWHQH